MKPLFTDLDQEVRASAELEKTLIEEGYLCTLDSDDDRNRQCALEYVQELLTRWQAEEVINLGRQEEEKCTSDPIIIPFGSYRLRVHHKDAGEKKIVSCEAKELWKGYRDSIIHRCFFARFQKLFSDIDILCLFDKRVPITR